MGLVYRLSNVYTGCIIFCLVFLRWVMLLLLLVYDPDLGKQSSVTSLTLMGALNSLASGCQSA